MEPEGSVPYSQVPVASPYPERAPSSPHLHIQLPEDTYYFNSIYSWVSQVVSFPQFSPPKSFIRLSSPPYVTHAPPISFCFSIQNVGTNFEIQITVYRIMYSRKPKIYLLLDVTSSRLVNDVSMEHSFTTFRAKLTQEEIICENLKILQNICSHFPIQTASHPQKTPVFIYAAFRNLKSPRSEVCNKKYYFLRTVYNCG